ncbi:MAG: hypothetical protein EOO42_01165 [Flavobacteriales bacterium]|nr:MAG: hypothetical protein EOO42_01165 [Flavobacteriales bacterium]
MLAIKRNGNALIQVIPDISDYQHKQRNGVDYVVLNFPRIGAGIMPLALGDTVDVYGQTYYLNKFPQKNRVGERRINLSCIFEAEHYLLGRIRYKFLDIDNDLQLPAFTITGDLSVFAGLLILNLNRDYPDVWSLGAIETTEAKNISFTSCNCLEAINVLIEQFPGIEFWVEGNVINLATRNINSGLVLGYGIRKGLTNIQENIQDEENAMPVTRVYAYGGSRNLPEGYRNYATTLQLDAPVELSPNPNNYPLNEADVEFPEVYPQYTGTVSEIEDELNFFCADLPFDVNEYLIAGMTAKVTFQSGNLAGYELELNYFNNTEKKFTVNKVKTETSLEIPSSTIFANVGDLFIITDISMPPVFVEEAEAKLLAFAQDYLLRNSIEKLSYSVTPDRKYFKDNQLTLINGTKVRLLDAGLGVNRLITVQSVKRLISDEWSFEVELADQPIISLATKLIRQQIKQANAIKPPAPIQSPKVYTFNRALDFVRNNCPAGQVGTAVNYKKKYISNVSMADASNMSAVDNPNFMLEGQANANALGTCSVPKPIIYISIQQINKAGNIAEFTVESSLNVTSDILVKVNIAGDVSGTFQNGTATITSGTNSASGFTTNLNGDFNNIDQLSGGVTEITPDEDANYRYYVA